MVDASSICKLSHKAALEITGYPTYFIGPNTVPVFPQTIVDSKFIFRGC